MARTRQRRSPSAGTIGAGTGVGSQQQAQTTQTTFVNTTIIPYLQTYQQRCLAEYAAVTGLIAQIRFGLGSSVQPQMTVNPISLNEVESLIGTPDVPAATQGLGGGALTGPVDKNTTVDAYILREMNNPVFANGFTSQKMRQHLQDKWGATRESPFAQNHVTNALRKHWEAGRLLAVGGNPLAKESVKQWFPANIQNPPAGAYTLQMAQNAHAGQQSIAAG